MKLKNLAAVISFLIAVMSCSMEDEVLNDISRNEAGNDSSQAEVYYSVNATSVITRAGNSTSNGTENGTFTTCDIILCEGDGIVGVYNDVTSGQLSGNKFLVKVGRKYEVLVIVDAAQDFSKATSKAAILATPLTAADMNKKVQFGRSNEFTATGDGSVSALDNVPTQNINVDLKQLTAQVRLQNINITYASGVTSAVTLKDVTLLNQNISALLTNANGGTAPLTKETKTLNKSLVAGAGANADLATFNTFPNDGTSNPTSLSFTLGIEGRMNNEVEKTYVINRPDAVGENAFDNGTDHNYIKAGYIYNLNVNLTVNAETVECTLEFNVLPWNLIEEEVSYVDIPTIATGRYLQWSDVAGHSFVSEDTEYYFNNNPGAIATCTFKLDDPKGATWHASLISVEGDHNAFKFVDGEGKTIAMPSGKVSEDAVLHILPVNPTARGNKAKLEIVVKMPDGNTLIAPVLTGSGYGKEDMIIIL